MKLTPRYYQQNAVDKIIDYLVYHPNKHPIVAMPTGSGKSLVIAMLIEYVRKEWGINVLILSHTENILRQDCKAIISLIDEPIGLYSAGLDSRTIFPVTVAGIQSAYRNPELFAQFDLVIIDEAHLVNMIDESMYRSFLSEVGQVYCGLTATPYRLGSGLIYGKDDTLFDDLVYDLTSLDKFNKLIEDGYLCTLKTMQTKLQFDTESLHHRGGEFIDSEMSDMFAQDIITMEAINETIKIADKFNYKKWLIFAIDIKHAEQITKYLNENNILSDVVHSKMKNNKADVLHNHRIGKIKALVNVNMLTTGYDDDEIDLIVMLRPTESPVLHVQSVGRGTRIAEGKDHCMVLDFAGNTKRLGPINNITIKESYKLKDGTGAPITKTCPECDLIVAPAVRICECGYKFKFKTKLETESTGYEIVAQNKTWYDIENITYGLKILSGSIESILVTYRCMSGFKNFTELMCLNHTGYARTIAVNRLLARGANKDDLRDCSTALKVIDTFIKPTRILVDNSKKYAEIIKYKF